MAQSFQPPTRRPLTALVGAGVLLATGCVDPAGRFDQFLELRDAQLSKLDAGQDAAPDASAEDCVLVTPEQLDGRYILAYVTPIAPDKPAYSAADIRVSGSGDTLDLELVMQPLDFLDLTREVGEKSTLTGTVTAESFTSGPGEVKIAGDANSIQRGLSGLAVMSASGRICVPPDFEGKVQTLCGTIDGTITEPLTIGLTGSTLGAVRVGDDGSLPPKTAASCAEVAEL